MAVIYSAGDFGSDVLEVADSNVGPVAGDDLVVTVYSADGDDALSVLTDGRGLLDALAARYGLTVS